MHKGKTIVLLLCSLAGIAFAQEPKPTPRAEVSYNRHRGIINAVAYSPDGKYIASLDSQRVKVTDIVTGKQVYEIKKAKDFSFSSLAYAPDGKTLAVGQTRSKVQRKRQGEYLLTQMDFFGNVLFCEAATGKILSQWSDHENPVWALAYSPDGRWLGVATGPVQVAVNCQQHCNVGELTLVNMASKQIAQRLRGNATALQTIAFSPDSRMVAAGGSNLQDRNVKRPDDEDPLEVYVWQVETGDFLQKLTGQRTTITSLAFSPDGKRLATAARDRSLKIWNTQSWKLEREASDYMISYDELLNLPEANKAKDRIPPQSWLSAIQFSPDSRFIIGGGGDVVVRIYDAQTAKLLRFFKPKDWPIYPPVFSPSSPSLFSASRSGSIDVTNPGRDPQPIFDRPNPMGMMRSFNLLGAIALSPDGKQLAMGAADGKVRLIDWE